MAESGAKEPLRKRGAGESLEDHKSPPKKALALEDIFIPEETQDPGPESHEHRGEESDDLIKPTVLDAEMARKHMSKTFSRKAPVVKGGNSFSSILFERRMPGGSIAKG
jgi:hypothetical protein